MRALPFLAFAACASAAAAPSFPTRGPVVLELFTSEGCSSCPPADDLLAELDKLPGVVALELHVDYWDDLGWKDPFSQAAFSERQARYDRAFHRDGVYTPQLVANGASQAVGSSRAEVLALVGTVAPAGAPVTLVARRDGDSVQITAAAPGAPADAELSVAVVERGLTTDVPRGENAGRRLGHGPVVRRLLPVPASGELRLAAPPHAALVALLQDRRTLRILGVARAEP